MADNCEPCNAGTQFHIKPLPGVPQGRFIVPLVRINGKVMDLPQGMTIPIQFLDVAALAAALDALEGDGEPTEPDPG